MAEPDADFDALLDEMGKLQEEHRRTPTPGTSTPSSSRPWTRCAARRRTPTSPCSPVVSAAASRCASCCCRSPTCCCSTSPPTTSTPRACSGWSSTWRSTPAPSLAVTHDRYFLDNVAEWILELDRGRAYPYEGNYSTYLEKKAERLQGRGQEGRQAAPSASRTSSSGCAPTPRPARPRARPAWPATRRWPPRPTDPQARLRGDPDPAGPAPGQRRGRGRRTSPRASTTGC